jgi:hypothetical protein
MQAVHPLTYHVVKAEEAHRLARLERRALARAGHHEDKTETTPHAHTAPVHRRIAPRAVGVAVATIALVLSLIAGGAIANSGGGGGGGGGTRISLE